MATISVLLIGLDPAVVNYGRWPGLSAEKLEAGLRRDQTTLLESGYVVEVCFIDHGETAAEVVRSKLSGDDYSCVLIGAGVRTDTDEFLLFEQLINVVHEYAPNARICFNTGPTDSVDAVKRWA
ncbi:MAG: hypothetical protein AAGA95_04740 [Pseudomonadota bacterium]